MDVDPGGLHHGGRGAVRGGPVLAVRADPEPGKLQPRKLVLVRHRRTPVEVAELHPAKGE